MTPGECPCERKTITYGRRLKTCCTLRGRDIWVECHELGACYWEEFGYELDACEAEPDGCEAEQDVSECEREEANGSEPERIEANAIESEQMTLF